MKKHLYILVVCMLIATNIIGQVNQQQANEIAIRYVNSLNLPQNHAMYFCGEKDALSAIQNMSGVNISSPNFESYFYFVDKYYYESWEHECIYLFVDQNTGNITRIDAKVPPTNLYTSQKLISPQVLYSGQKFDFKGVKAWKRLTNSPSTNNYAIIISGGYDVHNNYIRYWNDCQAMYKVLVEVYGYLPSHIYCLVSDGTNPNVDRNTGNGYDNSPLDFNGDGIIDIEYDATINSLNKVISKLSNILTQDDNLFVFSTDHGGLTNDDVVLYLWGESITATDFANIIGRVNAGHIEFVMEQCHSGGFIPKLCQSQRGIATACKREQYSYSSGDRMYNEFVYHWISAMGYRTPYGNPVNADLNSDGYISYREAFLYAEANDVANETPQYCNRGTPSSDQIGLRGYIPTSPADLYVRDSVGDIGDEPSRVSQMWVSPDIWIEDMDGNMVDPHGNDFYNVCVRIHNRSDYASSGKEILLLNWTKAGLDLDWSSCWLGNSFLTCNGNPIPVPRGGYIGDSRGTLIPSIGPHQSEVIKVKWLVPRGEDYKGCDTTLDKELWHFCLLARIHDGHPITLEDSAEASLGAMVVFNNNVAWRNLTILESKHNRSIVSVGNPFKELRTFSLSYSLRKNELGELLNKYADVYLNMSNNLFELWQKSDFAGKGFKVVDKNKILLTEPTATIERLVLQPEELYLLEAEVNFFTQEEPENNEFMFDIAEYVDNEKGGKELIGGETYIAIRNSERDSYFKAKAVDDKTVLPAEPVSFRAEPISEDAVYTWFDQKGDTVARGLNLTVTPTSTQYYKLEVVATADGFKDYDSVRATVRNGAIVSLSPNPTDNQLTITYRLAAGITNATIEISDMQNLSVQSYPIAATATTKTVSLAGLTAGTYVVKLIVDGEIVDTQQVIKN